MKRYKTITVIIKGEARAASIAHGLIKASRWFEMTPYPDDEWKLVVKGEPGADTCINTFDCAAYTIGKLHNVTKRDDESNALNAMAERAGFLWECRDAGVGVSKWKGCGWVNERSEDICGGCGVPHSMLS